MVGGGNYIQLRDIPKESDQSPAPPYTKGRPICARPIEMGIDIKGL